MRLGAPTVLALAALMACGVSGCFTAAGLALTQLCGRGDARCRSQLVGAGTDTDLAIAEAVGEGLATDAAGSGARATQPRAGQYECRDPRGWTAVAPDRDDARALCGSDRCVCTRLPRS